MGDCAARTCCCDVSDAFERNDDELERGGAGTELSRPASAADAVSLFWRDVTNALVGRECEWSGEGLGGGTPECWRARRGTGTFALSDALVACCVMRECDVTGAEEVGAVRVGASSVGSSSVVMDSIRLDEVLACRFTYEW